ncbi:MAG TPA: hypothetical protein EYN67_14160 [Flavobacteriales bacterium]|nr:hypothetical protein [Flavobacteriales bacterium]
MFSLIQKALIKALSLDAAYRRIEALEAKIERLEGLADENESLWQFLDEQKEIDEVFTTPTEDYESEITDMMLRNMKPLGDA